MRARRTHARRPSLRSVTAATEHHGCVRCTAPPGNFWQPTNHPHQPPFISSLALKRTPRPLAAKRPVPTTSGLAARMPSLCTRLALYRRGPSRAHCTVFHRGPYPAQCCAQRSVRESDSLTSTLGPVQRYRAGAKGLYRSHFRAILRPIHASTAELRLTGAHQEVVL